MKRFLPVVLALIIFAAAALISYGKICKGNYCNSDNASSTAATSTATSSVASVTPVIDNNQDFDLSGTDTPPMETGIKGKILLGPTCPVQPIDDNGQCADKPYQATVNVETPDGTFVKSFTSNSDGTYYVPLSAGSYIFLPISSSTYPIGRPITVSVQNGTVNTVNVYFDTGIR